MCTAAALRLLFAAAAKDQSQTTTMTNLGKSHLLVSTRAVDRPEQTGAGSADSAVSIRQSVREKPYRRKPRTLGRLAARVMNVCNDYDRDTMIVQTGFGLHLTDVNQ